VAAPHQKSIFLRMPITFENDNNVIVYILDKIISYATENQDIFLAQSIWWISSIIRLQKGLVIHMDNLHIRTNITLRKDLQSSSVKAYPVGEELQKEVIPVTT